MPGGEVDQAVAVDVLDDRARGPRGDDRVDRGERRSARPPSRRANHSRDFGPGISVTSLRSCGMSMRPPVARRRRARWSVSASSGSSARGCRAALYGRPTRPVGDGSSVAAAVRDRRRLYDPYNRAHGRHRAATSSAIPGCPCACVAGEGETDRPIRWVHVSELEDPTPVAEGRRAALTTGMGVGATPAKQRAYVKRLAEAGLAGLGFGLGFSHDKVPRALVTAAEQVAFPVFEVPYPVPFIAITEAVFTRILAEQYDTLQRAVDAEHVLTRAVMEGAGVEGIAASLARGGEGTGGRCCWTCTGCRSRRPTPTRRRGASGSGTKVAPRPKAAIRTTRRTRTAVSTPRG